MDRLIYTAMTGARYAMTQQASVANNLSNASTIGFRAMENRFRAVPLQDNGVPSRAFVADASVANVYDPGPMMATGRPLDVAVQGKGWIAVEMPDGSEGYTRAGNLQISVNGQLQTAQGLNILGDGGTIAVPPDNKVTIAQDGTVSVIPAFGTPNNVNAIGRIKLVNPPEANLQRGDDGFFRLKAGGAAEIDENIQLATQTLEGSNVNPAQSMIQMISVARQFETQIKLLQLADQNAGKATQILSLNG